MANVPVGTSEFSKNTNHSGMARTALDQLYVFTTDDNAAPFGSLRAYKGNVTGSPTSFTQEDEIITTPGTDGASACIDSVGIIHVLYRDNSVPEMKHVTFDPSTDIFGTPETVAALDNFVSPENTNGIDVDLNDNIHVVWRDNTNISGGKDVTYYSNNISGSFKARVQVFNTVDLAGSANANSGVMIGSPFNELGGDDRPILFISPFNPGTTAKLKAWYGDALDATSFTDAVASNWNNSVNPATMTMDNQGIITFCCQRDGGGIVIVMRHYPGNDWNTWSRTNITTAAPDFPTSLGTSAGNVYIIADINPQGLRLYTNLTNDDVWIDKTDEAPFDPTLFPGSSNISSKARWQHYNMHFPEQLDLLWTVGGGSTFYNGEFIAVKFPIDGSRWHSHIPQSTS